MSSFGSAPSTAASTYRSADVLSASPAQLVVLCYDTMLASYHRAKFAIDAGDVEARGTHLDLARSCIIELRCGLDPEPNRELAEALASLFTFWLQEIGEQIVKPDLARMDRLIAMAQDLRDAFAEAGIKAAQESAARRVAALD